MKTTFPFSIISLHWHDWDGTLPGTGYWSGSSCSWDHSEWKISSLVQNQDWHYRDVIMGEIASQITSLKIVYSTVYSDADQRKHQSSASLAFVRAIHRGPVNSPHKWPVTRKMFPFDDVIMVAKILATNFVLYQTDKDSLSFTFSEMSVDISSHGIKTLHVLNFSEGT